MKAWGESLKSKDIVMLADWDGSFSRLAKRLFITLLTTAALLRDIETSFSVLTNLQTIFNNQQPTTTIKGPLAWRLTWVVQALARGARGSPSLSMTAKSSKKTLRPAPQSTVFFPLFLFLHTHTHTHTLQHTCTHCSLSSLSLSLSVCLFSLCMLLFLASRWLMPTPFWASCKAPQETNHKITSLSLSTLLNPHHQKATHTHGESGKKA